MRVDTVTALTGGLRLQHEVAPAFRLVRVVEMCRVNCRAAAAAGEVFHEFHAHVIAGGNQEDAVVVVGHGIGEDAEFRQFREPGGDRYTAVTAVIFVGRGAEPDSACVHGVAKHCHHGLQLLITGPAPGGIVAHNDRANGGVRG